jgi:hypothetical protein
LLRLHLLTLALQKSHSLRELAPRPKSVFDRWASIEEGASRGEWCDHDAEEHVRNAMRLEPVPSGQLLPAVLGKVRELQSLAVELSRSAQIESEAMLPREKGGCVSPLLGSPRQRLADGLLKMILDTLGPERCVKMSSSIAGPFDRLLKAVCEYATGEKPKNDSFSDALTALPSARDKLVNRPGPQDRREMAAAARADKAARQRAAREKAEYDQTIQQLVAMDTFERRRMLESIRARAGHDRVTRIEHLATMASASSSDTKTWVKPTSAIKSGQPR